MRLFKLLIFLTIGICSQPSSLFSIVTFNGRFEVVEIEIGEPDPDGLIWQTLIVNIVDYNCDGSIDNRVRRVSPWKVQITADISPGDIISKEPWNGPEFQSILHEKGEYVRDWYVIKAVGCDPIQLVWSNGEPIKEALIFINGQRGETNTNGILDISGISNKEQDGQPDYLLVKEDDQDWTQARRIYFPDFDFTLAAASSDYVIKELASVKIIWPNGDPVRSTPFVINGISRSTDHAGYMVADDMLQEAFGQDKVILPTTPIETIARFEFEELSVLKDNPVFILELCDWANEMVLAYHKYLEFRISLMLQYWEVEEKYELEYKIINSGEKDGVPQPPFKVEAQTYEIRELKVLGQFVELLYAKGWYDKVVEVFCTGFTEEPWAESACELISLSIPKKIKGVSTNRTLLQILGDLFATYYGKGLGDLLTLMENTSYPDFLSAEKAIYELRKNQWDILQQFKPEYNKFKSAESAMDKYWFAVDQAIKNYVRGNGSDSNCGEDFEMDWRKWGDDFRLLVSANSSSRFPMGSVIQPLPNFGSFDPPKVPDGVVETQTVNVDNLEFVEEGPVTIPDSPQFAILSYKVSADNNPREGEQVYSYKWTTVIDGNYSFIGEDEFFQFSNFSAADQGVYYRTSYDEFGLQIETESYGLFLTDPSIQAPVVSAENSSFLVLHEDDFLFWPEIQSEGVTAYTWSLDGNPIDAIDRALYLSSVVEDAEGQYGLEISNAGGSTYAEVLFLKAIPQPLNSFWATPDGLEVSVQTDTDVIYSIEESGNLIDWSPALDEILGDGQVHQKTASGGPFVRVIASPDEP